MKLAARIVMMVVLVNVVIITHELGHFAAAEAFGFPAKIISIGFGPKIYSWTIREGLEGRISAIPFGSYVLFGEKAKERMLPAPDWQGVVLFGAGVAVNWLSPVLVLFALSRRYRRLDQERKNFPFTFAWKGPPPSGFWKIPLLGDTVFLFRCLVRPLGSEGLKEEWAWKYADFARVIGYMNLFPVVIFDGWRIYPRITSMLHIKPDSFVDWLLWSTLLVGLFFGSRKKVYRSLL